MIRTRIGESASIVVRLAAWSTPPTTCSGRSRVSGKTAQAFSAASARGLGLGRATALSSRKTSVAAIDADQAVQVVAVGDEVVGQDRQRARAGRRPAAKSSTGSTSGRPSIKAQTRFTVARARLGVLRVGHPARPAVRRRFPGLRRAAVRAGTGREARRRPACRSCGRSASSLVSLVVDAGQARLGLAEEGGEPLEVALLPGGERVVVALGAVEPGAEEGAGDPAGEPLGVDDLPVGVVGDGQEVGRRPVGPEPVGGDQLADDLVVRPVLQQPVAQPGDEPPAPEDEERPPLGPDVGPRQPLGEVVGRTGGRPAGRRGTGAARRPSGTASSPRSSWSEGTVPVRASASRRSDGRFGRGAGGRSGPRRPSDLRNASSTRRTVPARPGRRGRRGRASFLASSRGGYRLAPTAATPPSTTPTNSRSRIPIAPPSRGFSDQ